MWIKRVSKNTHCLLLLPAMRNNCIQVFGAHIRNLLMQTVPMAIQFGVVVNFDPQASLRSYNGVQKCSPRIVSGE
jgi:hypothetical protein